MNNSNYFEDIFESIPDNRKMVLLIFLFKNDEDFLVEIGFSERDINLLNLEIKNILIEEFENYLDYIKDEEESVLEKFLNKQMEQYFNFIFEDIRYERSLILLLSLVEPDILKQSKFNDHEVDIIKNIALEKLHRQRNLKEITALDLLEKQFSNQSI